MTPGGIVCLNSTDTLDGAHTHVVRTDLVLNTSGEGDQESKRFEDGLGNQWEIRARQSSNEFVEGGILLIRFGEHWDLVVKLVEREEMLSQGIDFRILDKNWDRGRPEHNCTHRFYALED